MADLLQGKVKAPSAVRKGIEEVLPVDDEELRLVRAKSDIVVSRAPDGKDGALEDAIRLPSVRFRLEV